MFIDWLRSLICPPCPQEPTMPILTSRQRITCSELQDIIKVIAPEAEMFLSDKTYTLCNKDDIFNFLVYDRTDRIEYEAEVMDCDDFSYRLMGNISIPPWSDLAFGIVWTNLHALNCYIGEDKKLHYVEPQADTIQTGLLNWQGDKIRLIVL